MISVYRLTSPYGNKAYDYLVNYRDIRSVVFHLNILSWVVLPAHQFTWEQIIIIKLILLANFYLYYSSISKSMDLKKVRFGSPKSCISAYRPFLSSRVKKSFLLKYNSYTVQCTYHWTNLNSKFKGLNYPQKGVFWAFGEIRFQLSSDLKFFHFKCTVLI